MICEDCYHYEDEKRYCDVLKEKPPSLLLSCDYFESFWNRIFYEEKLSKKKDSKARYRFSGDGRYKKLKMR